MTVFRGATMTVFRGATITNRVLVYVHGICPHDPGYSDAWWHAMAQYLSTGVRQDLGDDRHEVLWSEHVTRPERVAAAPEIEAAQQRDVERTLHEILQERMVREADEQLFLRRADLDRAGPRAADPHGIEPQGALPQAVLGVPGANCLDDFAKYLTIDSIRRAVVGEFTDRVAPLLRRGDSVEVISHSWGAVVAYEALRSLDSAELPGRVHNWFTVGAALAISFVARRLRPDDGQKPRVVDRWINLDARGDGVGGSLQPAGFAVDREYLRLPPYGCDEFFGLVTPACAHNSYFTPGNTATHQDIFAEWIERS